MTCVPLTETKGCRGVFQTLHFASSRERKFDGKGWAGYREKRGVGAGLKSLKEEGIDRVKGLPAMSWMHSQSYC